ncbi:MAG: hypothetical protein IJX77_09250 [Ruminococcus sp.]|nr:hypothetical protein [Ruminococcus sp.]
MEVIVKAEIKYTLEYFKAHRKQQNVGLIIYRILVFFLISAAAVCIISSKAGENSGASAAVIAAFSIIALITLLISLYYLLSLYFMAPAKAYSRYQKANPNASVVLKFCKDSFHTEESSDNVKASVERGYDVFKCVKETDGWFFLTYKKGGTIIINEKDIVGGSENDLRELFQEKLGEKYKIKKQ